ncbi:hypothetical protein [Flavobacterium sp. ZE23DGlu08]|uniref:hypothetical protein n=1 Tax=Flavobacterium sp. ZE23DGlu08 TaxID=3059026 RepID=UPI00265F81A3|nr:hypothetical protein [Flavobacterium sp. ZE23DGlu08]WKL45038.1 hypothetical protein Q1W72_05355 [Flavobacterium sp. ZE23DGlu08]
MRKEINEFLKSLLSFSVFTLFFYVLMICILGDYFPDIFKKNLKYVIGGNTFTRLQEVKDVKDVDILFLGSSHAYRGFDTRIFKNAGFTSFNLGSSSQTPIETEVLLKRYLDRLNPKLIVYEVYPQTFSIDGIESSLDIISNDINDINSIKMAIKLNNVKVYNTLVYSFYRDLFNKNIIYKGSVLNDDDNYIPGGYVQKKLKYYKHIKHATNKWKTNEEQFSSFENILKIVKKSKIRMIFVQAPLTKSFYISYSNNDEFSKKMRTYGDYHNYNSMIELNDSLHFYDENHLNQKGVEIFNKILIESLVMMKIK